MWSAVQNIILSHCRYVLRLSLKLFLPVFFFVDLKIFAFDITSPMLMTFHRNLGRG